MLLQYHIICDLNHQVKSCCVLTQLSHFTGIQVPKILLFSIIATLVLRILLLRHYFAKIQKVLVLNLPHVMLNSNGKVVITVGGG